LKKPGNFRHKTIIDFAKGYVHHNRLTSVLMVDFAPWVSSLVADVKTTGLSY
jgi:hypothetical protein